MSGLLCDERRGDRDARRALRHALRDAWPAICEFGWSIKQLCELDPGDEHVGCLADVGGQLEAFVRNILGCNNFMLGIMVAPDGTRIQP